MHVGTVYSTHVHVYFNPYQNEGEKFNLSYMDDVVYA